MDPQNKREGPQPHDGDDESPVDALRNAAKHLGEAKEYASKRSMDHLVRFNRFYDELTKNEVDENFLADCEWRDNLFPNVNWRYYIN